jgi:WD repeat-containing protein 19
MKQWQEAAKLYQKGGLIEKAASIYIQIKNFAAAAPLIE